MQSRVQTQGKPWMRDELENMSVMSITCDSIKGVRVLIVYTHSIIQAINSIKTMN